MFDFCKGKTNIDRTVTLNITKDNKITNLNSLTMNLIYSNLKKKYIEDLENLHHAISNLKTTHLYQKLKKDNLDYNDKKNENYKDMTCTICFDNSVNCI